ncbi:hypothetical protein AMTRI_Chr04g182670 [Amborella trichopoda]
MFLIEDHTPQRYQQRKLGSMGSHTPTSSAEEVGCVSAYTSFREEKNIGDSWVNVQVVLRCRSLSDDELRLSIPKVIEVYYKRWGLLSNKGTVSLCCFYNPEFLLTQNP